MTLAEKQERRAQIVSLWEDGSQPSEIAKRFRLTANYVRVVLAASGVDVDAATDARPKVDRIWDLDDDDRRREIIARASEGARTRLAEMAFEAME